ncbi:hypothetical protein [Sphaerotilus uruguayifluvii]|uniref:Uncharacterized protein n=1 Tax=Sphaerotilus uruguayifluvii TaxID=2735897 RepID=A0ABX2G1Q2_9BURK|nr:hypothetical protein [Leptothrix sp. C29]NRT55340.1 hypothetical protein [Leptothrix sp. C29]
MKTSRTHRAAQALTLSLALLLGVTGPAAARGESEASAASSGLSIGVPVAVSVTAPSAVLAAGAVLTVVSVQVVASGTVWVLERASDGARVVLNFSAAGVEAASMVAGTAVLVTAISAGWILSSAGRALCFLPSERGAALLHHERISR